MFLVFWNSIVFFYIVFPTLLKFILIWDEMWFVFDLFVLRSTLIWPLLIFMCFVLAWWVDTCRLSVFRVCFYARLVICENTFLGFFVFFGILSWFPMQRVVFVFWRRTAIWQLIISVCSVLTWWFGSCWRSLSTFLLCDTLQFENMLFCGFFSQETLPIMNSAPKIRNSKP